MINNNNNNNNNKKKKKKKKKNKKKESIQETSRTRETNWKAKSVFLQRDSRTIIRPRGSKSGAVRNLFTRVETAYRRHHSPQPLWHGLRFSAPNLYRPIAIFDFLAGVATIPAARPPTIRDRITQQSCHPARVFKQRSVTFFVHVCTGVARLLYRISSRRGKLDHRVGGRIFITFPVKWALRETRASLRRWKRLRVAPLKDIFFSLSLLLPSKGNAYLRNPSYENGKKGNYLV